LAQEQQSMNGNKGGSQYRCGGRVKRRHMAGGGGIPEYLNPNTSSYNEDLTGANDYMLNADWYNKITNKQQPYSLPEVNVSPQRFQFGQSQPPVKRVALDPTNMATDPRFGSFNQAYESPTFNAPTDNLKIPNLGGTTSPEAQGLYNNLENPKLQKTNNPFSDPNFKRPGNSGSAMDWMGLLPTAFNLGAGLFSGKAQHLNANKFQNPYEQQALSQMPSQYRIDPLLNEYKNAYANNVRNINNQGNSRGERMANYGAAQNQYGQQVGGAYAEKFNQENQMAARRAMMMNQQGEQRAQVNMGVQNMNDQNYAAAQNNRMGYLGAAASGAQRYGLVNKQMANQQASQMAYIRALANMPHFKQWLGLDPNNPLGIQQ